MTANIPTIEVVEQHYNAISEFLLVVWESDCHDGYWHDDNDDTLAVEALERMTNIMIDKTDVTTGQLVLDIGSGHGKSALELARKTGCNVMGINISDTELTYAKKLVQDKKMSNQVSFRRANAMDMPFDDNTFDAAWMFYSMFHFPDRSKALQETMRVLKPGGKLIIEDPTQISDVTEPQMALIRQMFQTDRFFTRNEHSELLSKTGFQIEEILDISNHTKKTYSALLDAIQYKQAELSKLSNQEFTTVAASLMPTISELFRTCLGSVLIVASKNK